MGGIYPSVARVLSVSSKLHGWPPGPAREVPEDEGLRYYVLNQQRLHDIQALWFPGGCSLETEPGVGLFGKRRNGNHTPDVRFPFYSEFFLGKNGTRKLQPTVKRFKF